MHLGNQLSPNSLLLLPNLLFLLLSYLCHPDLSLLTQRERESKKTRRYWRLGDLALRLKMRLNELQSSKRLDKQGREAQRGEKIKHLSLKLGFQLQCSIVSLWGITHPSGISMEAMDATWPRLWRRLYYSPMTWSSYSLSGDMRFSLTLKDIWAWYAAIPLFFFCFYIFMVICKVTNFFLSSYLSCF